MMLTIVLVSIVVYSLVLLVPGDPAITIAGETATAEQVEATRVKLGLDQPVYVQYLRWAGNVLQGDFGTSLFSGIPVTTEIMQRLPVTMSLALVTVILALLIAIPAGILASIHRGTWIDRSITAVSSIGMAMPDFWIGLLLVAFFALTLRWFPVAQYVRFEQSPLLWIWHLFLPALALAISKSGELTRQLRGSMASVLDENYIRTARAKGLRVPVIIGKHALKNAATAFVTMLGIRITALLGGVVVLERAFALPGLGSLAVDSVLKRDLPMVQGVALVTAIMVLFVNLAVDLSYRYFNPKVRI
ncbi:MAG: ABC transporter permease [Rhizobiaceae bacterium]|nr:ABC transporter permease [Rhizobiaceae bacterium]